jgi:hypothetical protein
MEAYAQFSIKKIVIKFPAINFFSILGHETLDPESGSLIRTNAGSGSALNQCGPETLLCRVGESGMIWKVGSGY